VVASATSVLILVQRDRNARPVTPTSARTNEALAAESEWAEKITRAIERLQVADQVIQRYGQRDVAQASNRVVSAATDLARGRGGGLGIDDAIKSFTSVLHGG
jgi:hypothetical protein